MPELTNYASQQQKLQQSQQLSAWQRTSLELLHLPLTALESRLLQEFTVNPVLEEESFPAQESAEPDELPANDLRKDDDNSDDAETYDPADSWADELPLPENRSGMAAERYLELLGNSPAPPPSLGELLFAELAASDAPERVKDIAAEIISMLDNDGFLRVNSADLAMICDCDLSEAEAALALVQTIAPPGVGARDLPESLRLQLQRKGKLSAQMEKLLADGMEDIAQNRLPKLAAKLAVSMNELHAMLEELRHLDPAPGRKYTPASVSVVRPEMEIESDGNGGFKVVPLRDAFCRIIVSPLYEKLSTSPGLSAEDKAYLQEKLARAKELIAALESRDSTLKQLGEFIMLRQRDFMQRGKEALKPMTMREAGEFIKVGESTVSRAVADKYIRTPHGVFPLKYFFSGGYGGNDGTEAVSSRAVMEKIRGLIAAEDPAHPLSDERIAALLRKQNLDIARRTVAKYRDILKIPGSSLRKKH